MREGYRVIESLMIVHNLCIEYDDHPQDWLGGDEEEEDLVVAEEDDRGLQGELVEDIDIDIPANETDASLREAGHQMRFNLLNRLIR